MAYLGTSALGQKRTSISAKGTPANSHDRTWDSAVLMAAFGGNPDVGLLRCVVAQQRCPFPSNGPLDLEVEREMRNTDQLEIRALLALRL